MATDLKGKFFVATREIYGDNSVKYSNIELALTSENYDDLRDGFDWGNTDKGSKLLASAILKKIGSPTIARIYTDKYTNSVIQHFKQDSWKLEGLEVAKWINNNTEYDVDVDDEESEVTNQQEELGLHEKEIEEQAKEERKIKREKEFQEEIKKKLQKKKEKEIQEKLKQKEEIELHNKELQNIEKVKEYKTKALQYQNELKRYKLKIEQYENEVEGYISEIDNYKELVEKQNAELHKYKELIKLLDIPSLHEKYSLLDDINE